MFLLPEAHERDDNLLFVRDYLLRRDADPVELLELYARVRRGRVVRDDPSSRLLSVLRLSGLVRPMAGRLQVRNRIYAQVFDLRWIREHMPDAELRRQRLAYWRGLWRATAASVSILAVVTALALDAISQARRADRAARQAKRAAAGEHLQRLQAVAARRQAEAAEAKAKRERERATHERRIADKRRAEAEHERGRAERAEGNATARLWASYLAQAQAVRWSRRPGRRFDGLAALARAAAIRPSMALRNEAIACMSLIDVRLQQQQRFERDSFTHDFSPDLKRVAYGDGQGNVWVRRLADGRLLSHFQGPAGLVGPVRFSPDGRFLTGAFNHPKRPELVVWDPERDRPVLRLADGLYRGAIDFSPDSRRLAAGGGDGVIHLYDLPSGRETGRLSPSPPPYSIQFDPAGRRLAVSSLEPPAVRIRDVATGAVITTLVAPTRIRGVAWHPHRNLVAGAGEDWHVYLWDVDNPQQPLARMEGHHAEVIQVGFRHDGEQLVSSSWDHTIHLWNLATQSQLLSLPGLSFSPGRGELRLGMMLDNQTAQIWELSAATECRTFRHEGAGKGPWSGAISRDGRLLASSGENSVAVWELTHGRQIASLPAPDCRSAFFHPTAPCLITSGFGGLRRWPIRTARAGQVEFGPAYPLTRPRIFERSAISRDGSTLAVGEGDTVCVLHFGPHAWQTRFKAQLAYQLFLDVSPDGRWIATGTWQGTGVNVWEARTGHLVKALPVNGNADVRFSPDGRWLATATGAVSQVWRTGSWQLVRFVRREDPELPPGSAAFTADGSVVALELTRQVIALIEASTGRELARLEAADVPLCRPLCFSQDGHLLATQGGPELLQVWDLRAIRRGLKAMRLDWPG